MGSRQSHIRYGILGLGHIAQIAVLPAFRHALANSRLSALVTGDPAKRRTLARRYRVPAYSYEQYPALVRSGVLDAVYIALPNDQHKPYAIQAAKAGLHVLCEKPLAVTARDAEEMVATARKHRVLLMTAYRLHFEKMNLTALQIARSGRLGDLRFFNSIFSLPVKKGDIRVQEERGGGSVYDLGIYCINAARNLFDAEPVEVVAASAARPDPRFRGVDEMTSVIMKFPKDRLAVFTSSLGAADTGSFSLVGTKGSLRADPAYEYASALKLYLCINDKTREYSYPQRDQFAAELIYFSDCVRRGREAEPSGNEGLADVRIIEAIYKSASSHQWVRIADSSRIRSPRPTLRQEIHRPKVEKPDLVNAVSASGKN